MTAPEGGHEPMEISQDMQRLAQDALKGTPIRTAADFRVYALPEGFMDHFVLLVWNEGHDFPDGREPAGFEMRLMIDGQSAYLMEESRAKAV